MAAATREDVLTALETIVDPASGKNVVASGMIEGLIVKGRPCRLCAGSRSRTRTRCRAVAQAMRGRSQYVAGRSVGHGHSHGASEETTGTAKREISAIAAGHSWRCRDHCRCKRKGGVGKSTVAVNLALGLAKQGLKVGLLDADIYGPSVPRLLGIREKPQTENHKLKPIEKFGIKTMSIGFLVDEGTPMVWRGPMVQSALMQMMNDVLWAPLDVVIVDMPPGTGDAQLTMAQRVPLKGAVIVSTPQDLALIDARKAIAMFEKTQVPILGIVENMSTYVCPNCGHESHIFGHAARGRRRAVWVRRSWVRCHLWGRSANCPMPVRR